MKRFDWECMPWPLIEILAGVTHSMHLEAINIEAIFA